MLGVNVTAVIRNTFSNNFVFLLLFTPWHQLSDVPAPVGLDNCSVSFPTTGFSCVHVPPNVDHMFPNMSATLYSLDVILCSFSVTINICDKIFKLKKLDLSLVVANTRKCRFCFLEFKRNSTRNSQHTPTHTLITHRCFSSHMMLQNRGSLSSF